MGRWRRHQAERSPNTQGQSTACPAPEECLRIDALFRLARLPRPLPSETACLTRLGAAVQAPPACRDSVLTSGTQTPTPSGSHPQARVWRRLSLRVLQASPNQCQLAAERNSQPLRRRCQCRPHAVPLGHSLPCRPHCAFGSASPPISAAGLKASPRRPDLEEPKPYWLYRLPSVLQKPPLWNDARCSPWMPIRRADGVAEDLRRTETPSSRQVTELRPHQRRKERPPWMVFVGSWHQRNRPSRVHGRCRASGQLQSASGRRQASTPMW